MQESLARRESGEGVQPSPDLSRRDPDQLLEKSPVLDVSRVHKVLVGIPLKGHTPPRSYHDRMLMWKHMGGQEAVDFYEHKSPRYVFSLGAIGEVLVPFARERLGDSALEMGCDYLFMVDDDMLTPPDLFYELVKHDKDICAALAFTRNPDHKPVIYQSIEGFDPVTNRQFGFTKFALNYPRNQLVQCDAVGFGAVLIKTSVLRKVPKPWFFGMEQTGEDVAFCCKARQVGCEVWMDTSIKLGHLGSPAIITEEYSDVWNKLTPEEREKIYGKYTKYQTDNLT
jgi:hypothetical protein